MKHLIWAAFIMGFTALQAQDLDLSKEIRKQFVGTWSLIAVENTNIDGSKIQPYGQNPVGLLVLTEKGDYAIQILKATRPKVKAGDKNKATPDENSALVQGNNSHFGTYSVEPEKHTITFHVQHAFYPNWEGIAQVRSYKLEDNMLRYVVTNTTNGGAVTATVVWKKNPAH
ncbi:lipocalin-like domain-containing protein [Olivibacter sp. CPCC 100613]|uniref:lipocalin-like domain-containing protein n=1 Tax=Olivibacter sp. CPCC 100613 TaxID=3079931 RepID=UPI002FF6F312